MSPRHNADYRTLLWLAIMPMYLAACAGVIAHNHNHSPTFKNKRANTGMAAYLSVFYGYPTFGWIPTHNLNHHKFVNKPGDATITWRHAKDNNLFIAVTYFFVSSYYQSDPIKAYIRKAKNGSPGLYRQIVTQYAIWGGAYVAMLALAIALHGWKVGFLTFTFALGIPALFALWMIMTFNYMQHVHCDPWSDLNHSRNYVGRLFNFLMFNNGYHTAHHENAGTHWSKLPAVHARIEAGIHEDLKVKSFVWWCVKVWILGAFVPSVRTTQIGRAPYDVGGGAEAKNLASADVEALEAGMNAEIAR
jgi:beta-carotene hydroxylase